MAISLGRSTSLSIVDVSGQNVRTTRSRTYSDLLSGTSLCLTTVGPPIEALTATGRVLAVVVACEGLILLPVFTVYVANIFTSRSHVGIVDFDVAAAGKKTSDAADRNQDSAQQSADK